MIKIPEAVRWTNAAIYCFERKSNCKNCIYKDGLETECLMKYTVLKLFEKLGKPDDINSKLKKKQLFVINYYGKENRVIELFNKMRDLKSALYKNREAHLEIMADVLNLLYEIILHDECLNEINELQDIKLEREINLIYQKKFKNNNRKTG